MDDDTQDEEYNYTDYIVGLRQQIAALNWMKNEITSLLHSITHIGQQLEECESLFHQMHSWGSEGRLSPTGKDVLVDGKWVSVYIAIQNIFKN